MVENVSVCTSLELFVMDKSPPVIMFVALKFPVPLDFSTLIAEAVPVDDAASVRQRSVRTFHVKDVVPSSGL